MKKIISIILILILSCCFLISCGEKEEECYRCNGRGSTECDAKYYTEILSGVSDSQHDCGLCRNGIVTCPSCGGRGVRIIEK